LLLQFLFHNKILLVLVDTEMMDDVVSLDPCQMVQKQNVIQILNIGVVLSMVFVEALQNTAIVIHASTIVPFRSKEKSDLIDDVVTIFHYLMAPHQNVLVLVLIIVAQSSVTVGQAQIIVNVQNALIIANRKLQETI